MMREHYNKINELAKVIHSHIYNHRVDCGGSMWESAKKYEDGIIGNIEYYKCLYAAIDSYGLMTKSEMSDMILEFEEMGLIVIDY